MVCRLSASCLHTGIPWRRSRGICLRPHVTSSGLHTAQVPATRKDGSALVSWVSVSWTYWYFLYNCTWFPLSRHFCLHKKRERKREKANRNEMICSGSCDWQHAGTIVQAQVCPLSANFLLPRGKQAEVVNLKEEGVYSGSQFQRTVHHWGVRARTKAGTWSRNLGGMKLARSLRPMLSHTAQDHLPKECSHSQWTWPSYVNHWSKCSSIDIATG